MIDLDSHKELKDVRSVVNEIIAKAKKCTKRETGEGTVHVFLDYTDVCECGQVDLTKERMK